MSSIPTPWLIDELAHLAGHEHQPATTAAWLLYGHGYRDGHAHLADALTDAIRIDHGDAHPDNEHPFVQALVSRITTRLLARQHAAACVRIADLTQRHQERAVEGLQRPLALWDDWAQGETA